ncbi:MAG: hypothetical protein EA384_15275 [Spirochaetaceae bacterium]|nr:MAG: hypothetical protein EA384_15275 [Spirochaetaceae bacterium]
MGFPGLLYDPGLSPHREQKLSIKVELNTNPPPHAGTETSLVRRHLLLNLLHYDKPGLLAGRLHAIIHRTHVKGRDMYDLIWYLSDPAWPQPNLLLLRTSLAQTGLELSSEQAANERNLIAARVATMEWNRVVADVQPFLERSEEITLLTLENVLRLLQA